MSDRFLYRAKHLGLQKLTDPHEELLAAIGNRDAMQEAAENTGLLDVIIEHLRREIDAESKKLD